EIVSGIGLSAEFRQHRGDIRVNVGMLVEEFPKAREVVAMKTEMCRYEFRAGMHCEEVIAFGHERFEGRISRGRPSTLRKLLQLEPALVVFVPRVEEGGRLGDVNQNGDAKVCALFEDRRKRGIIH